MITVHERGQPGWHRIIWLLEELKISYEIRKYDKKSNDQDTFDSFEKQTTAAGSGEGKSEPAPQAQSSSSSVYNVIADAVAASLAGALPPRHTPTITDSSVVIRESGSIVEYLIQQYGRDRFYPKTSSQRIDDNFFLHFAEGSFMPPLVLKLVFQTILEKSPFFVRPFTQIVANQIGGSFIDPVLRNNFGLVDLYLKRDGGRNFLAGGKEPTGGDFMMSWPVHQAVKSGAMKPEDIPQSMKDYLERLQARSAYQKASAKLESSTPKL